MPWLRLGDRRLAVSGLVLDKDGTLHRFDSYWVPLVEARIERLRARVAADPAPLRRGFGLAGDTVRPDGLLAQGTRAEAVTLAAAWLHEHGFTWAAAREAAVGAFAEADALLPPGQRVQPIPGLRAWLQAWVDAGGKLAVASTASRVDVDAALAVMAIDDVLPPAWRLGGDQVALPKPHPEMVQRLAHVMALPPAALAVVGDGRGDLLMGRAAGVAACIGVLSGVERAEDLAPHADHVVADLTHLVIEAE